VLDADNRIVDLNPEARAIIPDWQGPLLGERIERVFPTRQALIAEMNQRQNAHFEMPVGQRVLDIRYNALRGRNDRSIGRLIVLRDITARKQAEEERERLIGELDAYAHTVAHDLKNPLGVLITSVNYLIDLKPYIDAEKEAEYLQRIARTGHKMINIVDELLLLASVRKQEDVKLDRLDMPAVLDGAVARLNHELTESAAVIDKQAEWPTALGYAPWVEEVWVNYVSNAIKYGGTPPKITLGADAPTDGTARFWVRDNGQGLKPGESEKLFADFERLDATNTEGHGLGLSIVRRIVTRLGGEVGVESRSGEGSTFYFTLPCEPVPASK
jgi:signal transduction histidine kinase